MSYLLMERMTTQQCNYLLHNRLIRRLGFWSEVVLYLYFIAGGKSMQKYVGPEYGCCIIYVYP